MNIAKVIKVFCLIKFFAEKTRENGKIKVRLIFSWYTDEEKHQNNIRTYKLGWEAAKAALDDMKERTERLALHDATLQAVDLYKEQKSKGDSLRQIAKDLEALSDEMAKKNNEKDIKLLEDLADILDKYMSPDKLLMNVLLVVGAIGLLYLLWKLKKDIFQK